MKRKSLSILVCISMILSMIPFASSAEDLKERNTGISLNHRYDENLIDAFKNGEITDKLDIYNNNTRVIDLSDSKYGLSGANYGYITDYIRFTNPEITGVETVYQKYRLNSNNTTTVLGYFAQMYDGDRSISNKFKQRLPEVMNEVNARIPSNATDFEKVHIVHDYLISCTAYSQDNLLNDIFEGTDHDASGVLLNHKGMCQGYSLAFEYIMEELGIQSGVATSSKAKHAWNVVKIDNSWYHVDLTGDDKGYDILGRCSHEYLCISTESLLELDSSRSDFIVYTKDYTTSYKDDSFAVSKTYENCDKAKELKYCLDSYSPCIYYENYVYTVNSENNVIRYDKNKESLSEFAAIPLMESVWRPNNIEGWSYTNLVPRFAVLAYAGGNTAYINSRCHIYKLNLDTGAMDEIYSIESATSDTQCSIYGIAVVGNELMCAVEKKAGEASENWIKVCDVTLPETPEMMLIDPITGNESANVSISGTKGGYAEISVKNPLSGALVEIADSNIASASYINGKVKIEFKSVGKTVITLDERLKINVEVSKAYSQVKEVELTEGEKKILTFDGVNISSDVDTSMTDTKIAKVTAVDVNEPGTKGIAASTSKLSSFKKGSYILGYEASGSKVYLVNDGGKISTTSNPEKASLWNLTGSSSKCYLENNGYYINGSTSGISLSSSTGTWKFSSGRFYFSKSSGRRSSKYYLTYSSGFTVSTSTSNSASLYTVTKGTEDTLGKIYSTVDIEAVGKGNTSFEMSDVLYNITVKKAAGKVTLKVNIKDDAGLTLKDSYEISGTEGENYEVKADSIEGYKTPANITVTFSEASTDDINLVYILDTDKSLLEKAVNGKVSKGDYTEESYTDYEKAIIKGQTVLEKKRAVQSEVDSALNEINKVKSALEIKQKTITVKITDDAGAVIKNSYTITGKYGTSYTVTPEEIYGYITPLKQTGTYSNSSEDITLVYILNTDKTLLDVAVKGKISKGDYTDESYNSYEAAVNKGQDVLNAKRATQEEVDAALKAITDAKAALKVTSSGFAPDTDGIDSGSSYILVKNGYAVSGLSAVAVTFSGDYLNDPENTNAVWKITKTNSGYTIYNENSRKYLSYKASGSGSKRTCTPMLSSSKKYWKVSTSGTQVAFYVTSSYKFYLTCENGKFTMTKTASAMDLYKVK